MFSNGGMYCWHPLPSTRQQSTFWFWGSSSDLDGRSRQVNNNNNLDDSSDDDENDQFSDCSIIYHDVVLDIVGIMGLSSLHRAYQQQQQQQQQLTKSLTSTIKYMAFSSLTDKVLDPYCVVKFKEQEVHRTSIIYNDECPIYTIQTKSLCLIRIPEHCLINSDNEDDDNNNKDPAANSTAVAIRRNENNNNNNNQGSVTYDDRKSSIIQKDITIEICHGSYCLGKVYLSAQQIYNGTGERIEFQVEPTRTGATTSTTTTTDVDVADKKVNNNNNNTNKTPTTACILSLRYRKASDHDLIFLNNLNQIKTGGGVIPMNRIDDCTATDMNFKTLKYQSIFQKRSKKHLGNNQNSSSKAGKDDDDTTTLFLVKPGPDPDRNVDETAWMTKQQIREEAMKPATLWVTSGCDDTTSTSYGTIYLEIIGCDNIPNMDQLRGANVYGQEKSDPFVAVLFEDNMVRTDVIWDSLNPRWMPWTTRSFAFHVRHPSSLLMIGLFDYDDTPLDNHDPMGRVVIHTSDFDPNVTYVLHYGLNPDQKVLSPGADNDGAVTAGGTMTVRLRIEWNDPKLAMKLSFVIPPPILINVQNEKSFAVLRYLTRGGIDMDQAYVDSIQLYLKEIASFGSSVLYCLDVISETLLWRGRLVLWDTHDHSCNSTKRQISIWFPIHSIVLWFAFIIVIEFPRYIIPVFLYCIVWILLSFNYHASRHPYPWKRVKSAEESCFMMFFGRPLYQQVFNIGPNEGLVLGSRLEKLDLLKQKRVLALITGTMFFMLNIYRMYSKAGGTVLMTTEWKEWHVMSGQLHYLHLLLKLICNCLRRFRNFVNWRSHYTCTFTIDLLLLATVCVLLPINTMLLWMARIAVLTLLGPLMKVVDTIWVQSWYRTKEQLLELIDSGVDVDNVDPDLPDFDSMLGLLLESKVFLSLIHAGRVRDEDMYKLREIRKVLFGKYSDFVPFADNSQAPSVPLPQSTATSSNSTKPQHERMIGLQNQRMLRTWGQSLHGKMIPSRTNDNTNIVTDSTYGESKKNE